MREIRGELTGEILGVLVVLGGLGGIYEVPLGFIGHSLFGLSFFFPW